MASNSNFKERLIDRSYPQTMIENLLSDIKFIERESALLKHNDKEKKEILPFVTQPVSRKAIFLFLVLSTSPHVYFKRSFNEKMESYTKPNF